MTPRMPLIAWMLPLLALLIALIAPSAATAADTRAQALAQYYGGRSIDAINVTATDNVFEDRVVVRWPGAPGPNVFWRVKRDGSLLTVLSSQDSSYADMTGVAGQVYSYSVTLYDAATQAQIDIGSDNGSRIVFAPTQVTASDGQYADKILVTWSDQSTIESEYRVFRDNVLVATLTPGSDSYSDSTATAGATYAYCVRAAVAAGQTSAAVCDAGLRGFATPPAFVSASDGQIPTYVLITWTAPAGTAGFRVYRNNVQIAALDDTATSYQDAAGTNGVTYTYCVTSLNDQAQESIKICDDGGRGILVAPLSVQASDATFDDRVRVTWGDPGDTEDGFRVYRQAPAQATVLVGSFAENVTTFDDVDATPGVAYRYCVVAFTDAGAVSDSLCDMGQRSAILAPTAVQATDGTLEDRVDISWQSAATNVVLFNIYRNGAVIQTVSGSARSTSVFDIATHTTHLYGVRAVTALEVQSAIATDNGHRALNAPTELAASDNVYEKYVLVSWKDNSSFETGYVIERKLPADASHTIVDSVGPGNQSYIDESVAPGLTYTYRVRTFDARGTAPTGPTDTGSRTLAAPTELAATDGTFENKIVLTWQDKSSAEIGHRIYWRAPPAAAFALLDTVPANVSTYTQTTGITFGTVYNYRVVAYDLKGESAPQDDNGNTAILGPADVNASDIYTDKVTLSWVDRSAIETGYVVTRDGTTLTTTAANATTYTDNTAVAGTTYDYCVRATSAATSSAVVCDPGTRPLVPSGLVQVVTPIPWPEVRLFSFNELAVHGDAAAYTAGSGIADTVHVMHREAGVWSEVLTIPGDPNMGRALDLDAQRLIVGRGGAVSIYTRDASGNWGAPASVTGPGGNFGTTVSISGDRALVGEFNSGPGSLGRAFIYRLSSGTWQQEQELDSPGDAQFGNDVDLDDDRAIISSQSNSYIYKRTGTTWSLEATINLFGYNVGIDNTTAVIAGHGAAWAYEFKNGVWTQTGVLNAGSSNLRGAAIDGDFILVGDRGASSSYLYQRSGSGWELSRTIVSSDNWNSARDVDLEGGTGMIIASHVFPAVPPNDNEKFLLFDVLSPPGALSASDGQFAARVQLSWADQSSNESGFRVYRDGTLIDSTETNVRTYSDYDAEPGRVYEYAVAAFVAGGGESSRSTDFGRRPPDGSLTGRVATRAGAGVEGVQVCLDPAPASGLLFDGAAGKVEASNFEAGGASFNKVTAEFWIKTTTAAGATPFSYVTSGGSQFKVNLETNGQLTVQINAGAKTGGATTAVNDGQWHHIAAVWDAQGPLINVVAFIDGVPNQIGGQYQTTATIPTGGTLTLGQFPGQMDDVRMWRTARNFDEIGALRTQLIDPLTDGLMASLSFDEGAGPASFDLAGVDEYARMTGGVFWSDDVAPVQACAVTDLEGDWAMRGIHYGSGTTFRVTPQLGPHQFEPAYKSITLSGGSPVQNEVAFNDISSFTLAGRVTLDSTSCAATAVEVLVDGTPFGTTGEDGRFAVAVESGDHTLSIRQGTRVFAPASRPLVVEGDLANLDFFDKTPRMLTVEVGGGCNQPIGTLSFQVRTEDGCATLTHATASDVTLKLGPRKYQVQVLDVTGVPAGLVRSEILRFFQALGPQTIDLTSGDGDVALVYRAPVVVSIEGFDEPACPTVALPGGGVVPAVPAIQQGEPVPLTIRVYEDYGNGNHCPLDSTSVSIFDEIIDEQDTPVIVTIENGEGHYTTIGNTPNVFPGRIDLQGNDRSFQKPITVVADVPGQGTSSTTAWAIVTGHRPRAATFTSTTTEIPLLILRDPPGDGSSAFMEKGTSNCTDFTNFGLESAASGLNVKTEIGLKFQKGSPFLSTGTAAQVITENQYRVGIEATQKSGLKICTETLERWATPTDDAWLNGDGDLFMGAAVNLVFAKTDMLELQGCTLAKREAITMGSDGFSSTYVYTAKHIREAVIPQLQDLARGVPTQRNFYTEQVNNWRSHLGLNDSLKREATFKRNLSFSAGANYEYSMTSSITHSFDWTIKAFTSAELGLGFNFDESGNSGTNQWAVDLNFQYERGGATEDDTTLAVGFALGDNDAGDFFSVDVLDDPKYKTPVFKTVSGRSSCPVEVTTQPRDSVLIRIEPPLQDNIQLGEVAHYVLSVTNYSQSDEEREYFIQPIQTTNEDGASIFLVGDTFLQLAVNLKPGQTHNWEMTLVKGPSKFRYEDIAIMVMPTCQFDYWRKTGVMLLADTAYFSARWDAPCSDVTLFEPVTGWTYDKAQSVTSNNTIPLTLTDFELENSEGESIESVGAQYRPVGGEAWTTIADIPRASVTEESDVSISWNVDPLIVADGAYELRAYTRCAGGFTFSTPATGTIDRKSPQSFGAPQPADSLLSLGDEIAITFDEDIDCNSVTAENVTLQINHANGTIEPVVINVVCNGRTLILTPTDPDYPALEGLKLRARVTGIEDLLGNPMVGPGNSAEVAWRTLVRRNVFTWKEIAVRHRAPYRNPGSFMATLVNGTSGPAVFNLTGLPVWLTAVPSSGTIASGDSLPVELVISPTQTTLDPGNADKLYAATITANGGALGNSLLAVDVTIFCGRPEWVVKPGDFQHSMTVVALEQINGVTQMDPNDKVAAFVGNQLRGVASPIFVSSFNTWLTFITVYSNRSNGENVRFQVYDESDCRTYTGTNRTLRFEADKREGTTAAPVVLNVQDLPAGTATQQIAVNDGWTWVSFNLVSPTDMTVNGVLGDLNPVTGDLVKSQTVFSQFDETTGWAGTLGDFGTFESYALKLTGAGTIVHEGTPVPVGTTSVPVLNGWNWIPYLPQASLAINTALQLLGPQHGDVVKSQTHFAQYVKSGSVNAWLGNLTTMSPGLGYRMFLSNASVIQNQFKYFVPAGTAGGVLPVGAQAPVGGSAEPLSAVASSAGTLSAGEVIAHPTLRTLGPGWEVDARAYPYNMTVTAALVADGIPLSGDRFVVAAMVGSEIRGLAEPQFVDGVNRDLVFMMVYGKESESARITFRVYDKVREEVLDVDGEISFSPDLVTGSVTQPFALAVGGVVIGGSALPREFALSQNTPNPPKGTVTIRFALPTAEHVVMKVHDVAGREVMRLADGDWAAGTHAVTLDVSRLPSGLYFYRMEAGSFAASRKMIVVN